LFKKCDKIHHFYALCSKFIKINALIKMYGPLKIFRDLQQVSSFFCEKKNPDQLSEIWQVHKNMNNNNSRGCLRGSKKVGFDSCYYIFSYMCMFCRSLFFLLVIVLVVSKSGNPGPGPKGPSWPWSYGSCEFETRPGRGVQHYQSNFN
jgi:hypothetical protein